MSCRNPADLAGTCSGKKFIVSMAGEAYDVRVRVPNRKFRLKTVSAALGGGTTAVSGVMDIGGSATYTDVSQATSALSAVSNLGGLVTTAATGNIKAGQGAATVTGVASLATSPKDATKNVATTADAVQTLFSATDLVMSVGNSIASGVRAALSPNPALPPTPPPPSAPKCSISGAC
jgi:hypothetical protein